MVMSFKHASLRRYSNPLVFQNPELGSDTIHIDPDNVHAVYDPTMELMRHTKSSRMRRWPRICAGKTTPS